jgi:enamine deaminase RidA (YjgF/YER057c/UK114 family)
VTHRLIQPPDWPRGSGYTHGVAARGSILAIAGQVGWDPLTERMRPGFAAQAAQALDNIAAVLAAAGGSAGDIVRMTWFITDQQAYLDARSEIGAAYRATFGSHFPAMSVVIVLALLETDALVEIEATAVLPE